MSQAVFVRLVQQTPYQVKHKAAWPGQLGVLACMQRMLGEPCTHTLDTDEDQLGPESHEHKRAPGTRQFTLSARTGHPA